MKKQLLACVVVGLFCAAVSFAATPEYQPIPDAGQVLASGVADAVGPGGTAYVEYWVWNGGNDYYYYTYRIYNTNTDDPFEPFVKHLTIANPSAEPYVITSSSGAEGAPVWCYATYESQPTIIDWVSCDAASVIYPGQVSSGDVLFQYASKLPPSSAMLTVREGSLTTFANGLIPSPGSPSKPRSSGYWKHQYSGKGNRKEAPALPGYMNDIAVYSQVFAADLAGSTTSDLMFGDMILNELDNANMIEKAKKQLFALWLNVASHKVDYFMAVSYDPEVYTTTATTVSEAIDQIEATILNTSATLAELENAKDMAEMLNLM